MLFRSLFKAIVNDVGTNEESTTVNVDQFNLQNLVPNKPFFTYSATEPYQPCTATVEYIVFNESDGLDILEDTLKQLQTIIAANAYDIKTGPKLYYNESGPKISSGDGQIYIDCQPVGQSEETEVVSTQPQSFDLNEFFKDPMSSPFALILILAIIVIVIMEIVRQAFNWLTGSQTLGQIITKQSA